MQLANRSSIALLSSLFLRPNLPICSLNHTSYSTMPRAPAISVCHGGGPMPVMGDPGHAALIKSMSEKVPSILGLGTAEAPRAIVLVTAHWSERKPTISNGKKHKLYYDYGGFPPETYKLKYDAPGSPEVAKEVYSLLEGAGFSPEMDEERGVFILPSTSSRALLADLNGRLGSWRLHSHASHQPQSRHPNCPALRSLIRFPRTALRHGTCPLLSSRLWSCNHWFRNAHLSQFADNVLRWGE